MVIIAALRVDFQDYCINIQVSRIGLFANLRHKKRRGISAPCNGLMLIYLSTYNFNSYRVGADLYRYVIAL